jgi:ATP-dependent Clp protease adapter protein ClpS
MSSGMTTTKPMIRLVSPKTKTRPPPSYKLLLHKEKHQKDIYVVKIIAGVIKDMTIEEAESKVYEVNKKGISLLRVCPQEVAEDNCERIRLNGVKSTIEPV